MMYRHEDHWRCSFFIYCWEEGIKLPTPNDCPGCNGHYWESRSYKRPRYDDRRHRLIVQDKRNDDRPRTLVHDRLGGKASVHDRLGGKPIMSNRLEEMANNLVSDGKLI